MWIKILCQYEKKICFYLSYIKYLVFFKLINQEIYKINDFGCKLPTLNSIKLILQFKNLKKVLLHHATCITAVQGLGKTCDTLGGSYLVVFRFSG